MGRDQCIVVNDDGVVLGRLRGKAWENDANATVEDLRKTFEAGMNDHISKPIDPGQMFNTVLKWIEPGVRDLPDAPNHAVGVRDVERIGDADRTEHSVESNHVEGPIPGCGRRDPDRRVDLPKLPLCRLADRLEARVQHADRYVHSCG